MKLAYYITAHGYGHAARSCDILRALHEQSPETPIYVIADLPEDFFTTRLPSGSWRFRRAQFDIGMVQLDSIRVDVPATLKKCEELLVHTPKLLEEEKRFLVQNKISAAVCDIPAIPLRAAHACGIPAIAAGNFAWDWIYEEFLPDNSAWQPVVDHFRTGYSESDLLLRYPFAEPMAAFPNHIDIGVPARAGKNRRSELARMSGADSRKRWVLLSFTTLDWDDAALHRVRALNEWEFFTVEPLGWHGPNFHAIDRRKISYSDVLASCDVVLTKPGFGVLSECAVNDKPMIYVERTAFREYPILEAAVKRYFRNVHLPAEKLYCGDLRAALEAIENAWAPNEHIVSGGDLHAAHLILERSR